MSALSESELSAAPGVDDSSVVECDPDGRLATVADLREGDVFEWAPGSWYGVGTVIENTISRPRLNVGFPHEHRPALHHVVARAPVVSPPAVDYCDETRAIVIYARRRSQGAVR